MAFISAVIYLAIRSAFWLYIGIFTACPFLFCQPLPTLNECDGVRQLDTMERADTERKTTTRERERHHQQPRKQERANKTRPRRTADNFARCKVKKVYKGVK
jgi:hypothetical protein